MLYRWIRDLHLYLGLFLSPFVLLFAVSVFYLNHAKLVIPELPAETYQNLRIPEALDRLKGREAIERVRELLPQVETDGEIGFLRYMPKERRLVFPVSRSGIETTVEVDLVTQTATVRRRSMSFWESLAYLHKMPGPHNQAIRGNWTGTRAWRWFTDVTIYLLMFISISGLYLWWAIRAERRIGLTLVTAGALTFFGLIYAIVR